MRNLFLKVRPMNDRLRCEIPSKKEYISIPRLMLTGLAVPLDLDIDTLEDLKLIITESCNIAFRLQINAKIIVETYVEENELTIVVSDISEESLQEEEDLVLSSYIIRALADEVTFEDQSIFVKKKLAR